jgi:hypothetical protein
MIKIKMSGKYGEGKSLLVDDEFAWLGNYPIYGTQYGYAVINFEGKQWRVHRLILNIPHGDLKDVHHINENKLDCRIENLLVFPNRSAHRHYHMTGSKNINFGGKYNFKGENNNTAKLTADQIIEIRVKRVQGSTLKELGIEYGVCFTAIEKICTGKNWKHIPMPVILESRLAA